MFTFIFSFRFWVSVYVVLIVAFYAYSFATCLPWFRIWWRISSLWDPIRRVLPPPSDDLRDYWRNR